jgi:hypothetical protein
VLIDIAEEVVGTARAARGDPHDARQGHVRRYGDRGTAQTDRAPLSAGRSRHRTGASSCALWRANRHRSSPMPT